MSLFYFPHPRTQVTTFDLRGKAEVITVASKQNPTQTSPSLYPLASDLVSSILLIATLQTSHSGCQGLGTGSSLSLECFSTWLTAWPLSGAYSNITFSKRSSWPFKILLSSSPLPLSWLIILQSIYHYLIFYLSHLFEKLPPRENGSFVRAGFCFVLFLHFQCVGKHLEQSSSSRNIQWLAQDQWSMNVIDNYHLLSTDQFCFPEQGEIQGEISVTRERRLSKLPGCLCFAAHTAVCSSCCRGIQHIWVPPWEAGELCALLAPLPCPLFLTQS